MIKRYNYLKLLLLLILVIFYRFICFETSFFYISNNSKKEIKVIFIDLPHNDTLNKFILEPETTYNFYRTEYGSIWWQNPNDTSIYGMKLTITQDNLKSTKEYWKDSNWESLSKNRTNLNIRDEDF